MLGLDKQKPFGTLSAERPIEWSKTTHQRAKIIVFTTTLKEKQNASTPSSLENLADADHQKTGGV